jgi:glycosyltransferase involved in cell wall biosynthesis
MSHKETALPVVSIILPTFNRADTLSRAVQSVILQKFPDWELLIIDDGSTDNTVALVEHLDPRIRIFRQKNAGVYAARNRGLALSRGEYITFLDSDDEWMPNFLAITVSFLRAHPQEHFVATEFLQDWGTREHVRHDYQIIVHGHLKKAHALGSKALDLPAGEDDDYLRVYREKLPVGAWASQLLPLESDQVYWYRGRIFEHMRWGYLNWLPAILITRKAVEAVGPFREEFRNGADFYFLALLAQQFTANMIGLPCAFKHEKTATAKSLREEHLAAGKNSYRLAATHLQFFEELFFKSKQDRELYLLHKTHHLACGRSALQLGQRRMAMQHLRKAAAPRRILWRAYPLWVMAALSVSGYLGALAYTSLLKTQQLITRMLR